MKVVIVIMALTLSACDVAVNSPVTDPTPVADKKVKDSSLDCMPHDLSKYPDILNTIHTENHLNISAPGQLTCALDLADTLSTLNIAGVDIDGYVIQCNFQVPRDSYTVGLFDLFMLNYFTPVVKYDNICSIANWSDPACMHEWTTLTTTPLPSTRPDLHEYKIIFHNREDVPTKMCTE